jgi:hypothetical protein
MKRKLRPRFFALLLIPLFVSACLGRPASTDLSASTPSAGPGSEVSPASITTAAAETWMPAPRLGMTVVYLLNGDVWLWDESAPARQLTRDGDVAQVKLSEDGAIIVYQRGQTLWAVNADGSSPRLLVDIVPYAGPILPLRGDSLMLYLAQYEFQPGTHWVYFTTSWTGSLTSIASNDLHRVDANAPAPQALLTEGGGRFTFSPDGNLLALASRTDIKVIRADGSGLVTALPYPVISNQMDYKPPIVWLKDSTGFYTVIPSSGKSRFLYVAATGAFFAQLAEFDAAPIEVSEPMIAPDGSKVAYVIQTASSFDLHVMDASTADVTIASHAGAPLLELWGWSPDSKRIAYWNSQPVFVLTAGINLPSSPLTESITPYSLRWVSADRFIFFREGELLIGQVGNPNDISIASGFPKNDEFFPFYDFILTPAP